jgi:hypothetical protein
MRSVIKVILSAIVLVSCQFGAEKKDPPFKEELSKKLHDSN